MTPEVPLLDELTKEIIADHIPNTDTEGWSHHIGGSAAIWLGLKPVFVGLELAAAWIKASPTPLGTTEEFSLVQISPNITLVARFKEPVGVIARSLAQQILASGRRRADRHIAQRAQVLDQLL